jgi:uncharacterized protein (DUF433 family)
MAERDLASPADRHLLTPLYSVAEAARVLAIPASTLRNWAVGYVVKRADGRPTFAFPLITSEPPQPGRASVPFIGLAEAYTLLAFKAAGVPVLRIRPAIRWLEEHLGLAQALASERLMTDGAEVLYDFASHTDDAGAREAVDGLVVVRSGQQIFRPVVRDYLSKVVYRDGWISLIHLSRYGRVDVIVDPHINGGRPTVGRRGIPVSAVLSRLQAGESRDEVAADYHLTGAEVGALQAAA